MAKDTLFKLDEDTKNTILEVSALSGISQNIVKEAYEYLLISWAVKLAENPDKYASLNIPYMGTVGVKFKEDRIDVNGNLVTEVDAFIDLADPFKKLVGDVYNEEQTEIIDMLKKKIKNAITVASATD